MPKMPKKTWASIRSIINIRSIKKGQPTSILVDENLETDPTLIGENFNTYFTTIAEKLQKNIFIGNNNFVNYLNTPLDYNFLFRSADSTEIIMITNSLESGKASGPHSIPNEIIQTIKQNICYPLKEIINMSFATGVYPDKLKIAKVIPIYKNKGDEFCWFRTIDRSPFYQTLIKYSKNWFIQGYTLFLIYINAFSNYNLVFELVTRLIMLYLV